MPARKETTTHIVLADGSAMDVRILDGISIDDVLIQGMKAEGYRVVTGREQFPTIVRSTTDYLIRVGVIAE